MFARRAHELRERMDDPHCDPHLLRNTYAQFAVVNRLVTGWGRVMATHIEPLLRPGDTILDVGCGGGDVCRRLLQGARRAGKEVRVIGIDPDPRAIDFAQSANIAPGIEYRRCRAEDLIRSGERFDFVVSNHLLHHLSPAQIPDFLENTGKLARKLVVHNDLSRGAAPYLAFALTRPFFRRSFIVEDGLRSIRRAYTPDELREMAPCGWRVESLAPFRNLVILES